MDISTDVVMIGCLAFNCVCIALVTPFKYPYSVLLIVPLCIKSAFNLADDEIVACFASNAACNPEVLAIVKLASVIVACFASNAACNPLVFAIVKLPSVIVACFASNAPCNPLVLAIVKLPSVIVACFAFNCVCIALVTPFKYPYSVLLIVPLCIKSAFNLADDEIVACFASNAACNPEVLAIVKLASVIVACFASNAACNPLVFAIVKLPSVIVACFVFICVCKLPNVFVTFVAKLPE